MLALAALDLAVPDLARAQDYLVPVMDVAAPAGARALCRQYVWACARSGRALRVVALQAAEIDLAHQINLIVNRSVRSLTDEAQYGKPEVWALAGGLVDDEARGR